MVDLKDIKKENVSQTLVLMAALLLPISSKLSVVFIGLLAILWAVTAQYKNLKNLTYKPFILMGLGLFVLNLIGLSYSDNFTAGRLEIDTKLSFALLPFLLLSGRQEFLGNFKQIMIAFVAGCVLAGLFCLGHASYQYMVFKPWLAHFFGVRLSVLMHMGFFALYLNIAVLFCIYLLSDKELAQVRKRTLVAVLLFLVVLIVMTTSKNGIIVLVLNATLIGVLHIRKTGRVKQVALAGSVLIGILSVAWISSDYVRNRFIEVFSSTFSNLEEDPAKSTSIRRVAWQSCVEIIKTHPLQGVGTGDVKSALFGQYKIRGYNVALEKQIGPHNQFLQTFAELGVFAFLLLIVLFLYVILIAIKRGNMLLLIVTISILVGCLTESLLERQAGIVAFNFFLPLLLRQTHKTVDHDSVLSTQD